MNNVPKSPWRIVPRRLNANAYREQLKRALILIIPKSAVVLSLDTLLETFQIQLMHVVLQIQPLIQILEIAFAAQHIHR